MTWRADAATAWFKYLHVYLKYIWRIKNNTHYRHMAHFHVNQEMFSEFMPASLEPTLCFCAAVHILLKHATVEIVVK